MIRILHRHTRELLLNYPHNSFVSQDLRKLNLKFADLSRQDLTEAVMEGMNLDETEFSDSILVGANMAGCSLHESILDNAKLIGAKLNGCKCSMTAFTRADLTKADLSDSEFEGVTCFIDVIAVGTIFRNIKKFGSPIFENTDCRGADFTGTDLTLIPEGDILNTSFDDAIFDQPSKEYLKKILRKELK